MATLTYDPAEPKESELTAEEQESLKVGEALQEQEQQKLAGKFESAEELEKAYIELQSKLGEKKDESDEKAEPESKKEEEPEEEPIDTAFLEKLWEESQGEYTEDTLKELKEMDPQALAQMYLQYRSDANTDTESVDLTEEEVKNFKQIAGGEQEYAKVMQWATNNLEEREIEMFDSVMNKGDKTSCWFAIQALTLRYQDAIGVDGQMLTGKPAKAKADVFRSQAEVVKAMSDPQYERDPAYRQDVYENLERSKELKF